MNVSLVMIERATEAALELEDISKQIVSPLKSKRRFERMAFAVRWLIEDSSVAWAVADNLHENEHYAKWHHKLIESLSCAIEALDVSKPRLANELRDILDAAKGVAEPSPPKKEKP